MEKQQNFDESQIKSEELFHILGKRWTLPVIRELAKNGAMGFNQIKNHFQKITPTTLSSILKTLEQNGIIKKKNHHNLLSSVSYFLTNYGVTLHELSIMVETISGNANSTTSMKKESLRKTSTIIKNFKIDNSKVLNNEIRKYLIPLATLASVGVGLCSTHGIQHMDHLTSFY